MNIAKLVTVLALILALLLQFACAEPSAALQGVFDAMTAEDSDYFNVVANLEPGTAGVSLKTAVAASEVCAFAGAHALYNPDVESLRTNMLAAFEAMDKDEQAAFWQGFDAVRGTAGQLPGGLRRQPRGL